MNCLKVDFYFQKKFSQIVESPVQTHSGFYLVMKINISWRNFVTSSQKIAKFTKFFSCEINLLYSNSHVLALVWPGQ